MQIKISMRICNSSFIEARISQFAQNMSQKIRFCYQFLKLIKFLCNYTLIIKVQRFLEMKELMMITNTVWRILLRIYYIPCILLFLQT